ncbi:transposase [Microbispora sp. NPDC046933]|uniref:IS701 family transposase n=1 Tax=Microbispora sp. NPDC046933 TaxID=3155618 RepID=UPI00340B6C00
MPVVVLAVLPTSWVASLPRGLTDMRSPVPTGWAAAGRGAGEQNADAGKGGCGAARRRLALRAVDLVAPEAWVLDDTGHVKDGDASPGVARQYTGTAGKVANCQIAVSVHAVTDTCSAALNWRLFLPDSWDDALAEDEGQAERIAERRRRCAIPEQVRHRPKWQLALDMLDELAAWALVPPLVVADAGYGEATALRLGLTARGIPYVVSVKGATTAYPSDAEPQTPPYAGTGRRPVAKYRTPRSTLREPALAAGRGALRRVRWRRGEGLAGPGRRQGRIRPAAPRSAAPPPTQPSRNADQRLSHLAARFCRIPVAPP